MSTYTPSDYSLSKGPITRTYDVSYYGYDLVFNPIEHNPVTITTITNSTTTRTYQNGPNSAQGSVNDTMTPWDISLMDTDLLGLFGPANDTDVNTFFELAPNRNFLATELNVNVAFGMNISAWVNGATIWNNVGLTLQYADTSEVLYTNTFNTGQAAVGATLSQMFILNFTANLNKPVLQGRRLLLNLTTGSTKVGTNTRQMGIFSHFSYGKQQAAAIPLPYVVPTVRLHMQANTSYINTAYITGDYAP